jgi:hypothetical protein
VVSWTEHGGRALPLSTIFDGEDVKFEPDPLATMRATAREKASGPSTWGPGSAWVGRANKRKSVYGVALHAVTLSSKEAPPFVEAISVTPAPALPAKAATPLLELLVTSRKQELALSPLGDVVADLAYSANPKDWQLPIRHMGGSPIFRLHRHNQAGRDIHQGVTFVDGRPYCSCIPDELAEIPFPRFPAKKADLIGFAVAVTKRRPFEMPANTSWRDDLSRQFRFPHWKPRNKRGGCPHCTTREGGQVVDPTTGMPRQRCCERATKVFLAEELGLYQDVPFGELEWFERWNRRDRVEGSFGILKNFEVVNWGHDYHHFVGLPRETLVATFAVVGHNVHIERAWKVKGELKESEGFARAKKKKRLQIELSPDEMVYTSPAGRGPKGLEFLGTPRAGP